MNHIQWPDFRPRPISAKADSYTPLWAAMNLFKSKVEEPDTLRQQGLRTVRSTQFASQLRQIWTFGRGRKRIFSIAIPTFDPSRSWTSGSPALRVGDGDPAPVRR